MNYKNIYYILIDRSKTTEEDRKEKYADGEYYEKHHIIPKCMGGNNLSDNIAYLTPEEHFLAHLLLIKIYPTEYSLYLAIQIMIGNGKYKKNNKLYGKLKRSIQEQKKIIGMPEATKMKISKSKKGVKFSNEHKSALSRAKKGRSWEDIFGNERASSFRKERSMPRGPMPDNTRQNISLAKKGIAPHAWTQEMKEKTSNTMLGVKKSEEMKLKLKEFHKTTKVCPYCHREGSGPSMQRWHFNNCKDNNVKN